MGFPFDDDPFKRKTSKLKDNLHGYLAERYPDIADTLKDWSDDSFERNLDNKRPPSGRRDDHQNPSGRQRAYFGAATNRNDFSGQGPGTSKQDSLRNTVPNMQSQQEGLSEKQRNARSQSAPPEGSSGNCRPDKADFSSAEKNGETNGQSNANVRNSHLHEEQAKPQTHTSKANERYIPIFVEGRGETIVNVPVQKPDKVPQPAPSFARQSPPRSATPNSAPKESAESNHQNRSATPSGAQATPTGAQATPTGAQATPTGTQATPTQEAPPAPEEPQERPQTPARPPSPMTQVANVQKDVLDLKQTVDAFKGSKSSKEYIYLDEMLTRNLLKLDNIETGGKEEVRAARKEVIKLIQECINVLEAASPSEAAQ